ncbi:hypothetical protein ACHAWO_003368, partial [Cyclotella atomus]
TAFIDSNLATYPPIVINPANYDTNIRHRTKITLHDLKKVLQEDLSTSEVTIEQIKRVKMMHDNFYEGSVFNFNYNTLLIVASVIAALGLVSDSTATVIASMLVSPIMGPVVALAYGTTILDRKMVKLSWTVLYFGGCDCWSLHRHGEIFFKIFNLSHGFCTICNPRCIILDRPC